MDGTKKVFIYEHDGYQTYITEDYWDYGGDYYELPLELFNSYNRVIKELSIIQDKIDKHKKNNEIIEG